MSLKQQLNRWGGGASLAPFCIKSLPWKEVNVRWKMYTHKTLPLLWLCGLSLFLHRLCPIAM